MCTFLGGSDVARTTIIGALVLPLIALMPIGNLWAQVPGTAGHDHLTEVACVDVPPGEKRPEFGCFNVGTVTGLHFSQTSVYWHLRAFPSRKAAEAAKSATGIVVEEDGRVWLSEFGPRNPAPRGGEAIAIVGPMELPAAKSYSAVLSYAVMRPGDNSRVHTHPGPAGAVGAAAILRAAAQREYVGPTIIRRLEENGVAGGQAWGVSSVAFARRI